MAAAVGAGFHFIDGAKVAKLVERPGHVTRFTLGDVYRAAIRWRRVRRLASGIVTREGGADAAAEERGGSGPGAGGG